LPASAEAMRSLPTPGIEPSPELSHSLRRAQSVAQKSLRTTMLMPPGTGRVVFRIRACPGCAGDPLLRLHLVGDGHVGHAEAERDEAAAAGVAVGHLGELGELDVRFGEQALGDVAAQRVLLRQVEALARELVDRVDVASRDERVGLLLAARREQLVRVQDRRRRSRAPAR
jgi:hypothetical protein